MQPLTLDKVDNGLTVNGSYLLSSYEDCGNGLNGRWGYSSACCGLDCIGEKHINMDIINLVYWNTPELGIKILFFRIPM